MAGSSITGSEEAAKVNELSAVVVVLPASRWLFAHEAMAVTAATEASTATARVNAVGRVALEKFVNVHLWCAGEAPGLTSVC
jgi:hypothetical protein